MIQNLLLVGGHLNKNILSLLKFCFKVCINSNVKPKCIKICDVYCFFFFFTDFYICTQILFSCCVFLTLVGLYYTVLYLYCDLSLDHLTQILLTIWRYEIASGNIFNIKIILCYYYKIKIFNIYVFL